MAKKRENKDRSKTIFFGLVLIILIISLSLFAFKYLSSQEKNIDKNIDRTILKNAEITIIQTDQIQTARGEETQIILKEKKFLTEKQTGYAKINAPEQEINYITSTKPQEPKITIGQKNKQATITTSIIAAETAKETTADIILQKNGPVNTILYCMDWNVDSEDCPFWEETSIAFTDNQTHIFFSIPHFTGYAGGWVNQTMNHSASNDYFQTTNVSSNITLGTNVWTNKSPSSSPSARRYHAMAYDSDSKLIVMHGGNTGSLNVETWIYNLSNNTWTNKSPSSPPSARYGHKMAYDSDSRLMVMYGGNNGSYNAETWIYNLSNNTWTNMNPSSPPTARYNYVMAYDSDSRLMVMYGGNNGSNNAETWIYNLSNNTWTNMNPSSPPTARNSPVMAYDSDSKLMMLNGGFTGAYNAETWIYNLSNNTWTNKNPSSPPTARYYGAMVYDSDSKLMMLYGGFTGSNNAETWIYKLGYYSTGTYTQTIQSNNNQSVIWDRIYYLNKTLGGTNITYQIATSDDNTTWTSFTGPDMTINSYYNTSGDALNASNSQYLKYRFYLATDDTSITPIISNITVKYYYPTTPNGSGKSETAMLEVWDDSEISQQYTNSQVRFYANYSNFSNKASIYPHNWINKTVASPSRRYNLATAFDSQGKVSVFFGGNLPIGTALNETWIYNYSNGVWTMKTPINMPSSSSLDFMANDLPSGLLILYKGGSSDTWAYNLSDDSWTNLTISSIIHPRTQYAMAYDSKNNVSLIFGGINISNGVYLNDTWMFNLSTNNWTELFPSTAPSGRRMTRMVYVQSADVFILFGGYNTTHYRNDTWAYNFTANTWSLKSPSNFPSSRASHTMSYDSKNDAVVLFGGTNQFGSTAFNDTWVYHFSENRWAAIDPVNIPPSRSSHSMTYDSANNLSIFFGGSRGGSEYYNDTWASSFFRASCFLLENSSGTWSNPIEMDYNSSLGLYVLALSIDYASTRAFNITCNGSGAGFDVLSAIDSFNLSARDTCNPNGDNLLVNTTVTCDAKTINTHHLNISSSGRLILNGGTITADRADIAGTFEMHNSHNTIWQNGNLTISGEYVLDNSTLRMNVSSDGEFGINVSGTMLVVNGSNITNGDNSTKGYFFRVYPNANFTIQDSLISGAGYGTGGGTYNTRGLWINANNTVMQNSTIIAHINNSIGLILYTASYNNMTGNVLVSDTSYGLFILQNSRYNNIIGNNLTSVSQALALSNSPDNPFNFISDNWVFANNAVCSIASTNTTFTNNTCIATTGIGLYVWWSSNRSVFANNNVSSDSGYGLEVEGGSNTFTGNRAASNSGPGSYLTSSSCKDNIFINNTFESNTNYGNWIRPSTTNNTFISNQITSNSGIGNYLQSSANNTFTSNIISSNTSQAVLISLSNYTTFINCNISSGDSSYDFNLTSGSFDNYIINSTFNKSKLLTPNGSAYIQWYLDVYVNDSLGADIENANVSVFNNTLSLVNFTNTSASGWTQTILLTEYLQNKSGSYLQTNYTINASKDFSFGSQQVNLTQSYKLYMTILLPPPTISVQYPLNESMYNSLNNSLNYTIAGGGIDKCWIVNGTDGLIDLPDCANTTFMGVEGYQNITVYVNNTENSIASQQIFFTIDSLKPQITVQSPVNASAYVSNNLSLNFTASDLNGVDSCWFFNSTGQSIGLPSCANSSFIAGEGLQNVTVFVNDSMNNVNSSQVFFSVDSIVPVVAIDLPLDVLHNSTSVSLNFTAFDMNLDACFYELNGGANTTLSSCDNVTIFASNGANSITVFANDSLGHVGSASRSFSVDTVKPELIVQHPGNASLYDSINLSLNFTVSDVNGVDSCWFFNSSGQSIGLPSCANSSFIADEGLQNVTVFVNDSVNNVNSSQVFFSVDLIAPSLLVQVPVNNTVYPTSIIDINFTVIDPNLDTCQIINSSGAVLDGCDNLTQTLADGTYNVTISVNDTFNHMNSTQIFFTIDTSVPIISIQTPQAAYYPTTALTLNYTAQSATLDSCWYELNGAANQTAANCQNVSINCVEGENSVNVFANDSFNRIGLAQQNFTVDTIDPAILMQSPTNNSIYGSNTISINYTISEVNLDECWMVNATGQSINLPSCANNTQILSDGFWNVTVYINDSVNRINSSQVFFTVDTVKPSITVQSPVNASAYVSNNLSMNFTVNDVNGVDSCWFFNSTGQSIGLPSCANSSFIASEGLQNVTVFVNDSVNNVNSSQIFFTVDSIKPAIQFVSPTVSNNSLINYAWNYINVSVSDASQTSAFIDFNRSLVGYWNFEQGYNDSSTYANNGSCSGATCPTLTTGKFGKAYAFDGVNSYVNISNQPSFNFGLNDFSISVWLKSSANSWQYVIDKQNTIYPYQFTDFLINQTGHICFIASDCGTGSCGYGTTRLPVCSQTPVTDDTWHMIVGVRLSSGEYRLYINGVLNNLRTEPARDADTTSPLYFGRTYSSTNFFNGSIDEVRIFNRALSEQEINASYNAGLYQLEKNFTGLSEGNHSYSASSIDAAGNINNTGIRYFVVDMTGPLTTDNSTQSLYWFVDEDATVMLNASDENTVNATYYCSYNEWEAPCSSFTESLSNPTIATISCAANSACQKIIRYYSVDMAGNAESPIKESANRIFLVRGSFVNNTNATYTKITDDSYITNSSLAYANISGSTISDSNLSSGSFDRSTIQDSQLCSGMSALFATINNNVLTAGRLTYAGHTYYAPANVISICNGLMPSSGVLSANATVVKNNISIKFTYTGLLGAVATLNLSNLDSSNATISLADESNNGIYYGNYTISSSNNMSDGQKQVVAVINDGLGNLLYAYLNITLDNTAPSGSLSINNGDSSTSSRSVILNLNYSDANGIDSCRFANESTITSQWESCTQAKSWQLTSGYATKTIFAEVKDKAGNVFVFNDSIIYSATGGDSSAPTISYVLDGLQSQDINYTNSNNTLSAHWDAIDYSSPYVFYKYRILANGTNITGYVDVGQAESITINNLALSSNTNYSIEIFAYNLQNSTSNKSSDGVFVDLNNPNITSLTSPTHPDSATAYANNTAVFKWTATDDYSIAGYSYSLDQSPYTEPDNTIDATPVSSDSPTIYNLDAALQPSSIISANHNSDNKWYDNNGLVTPGGALYSWSLENMEGYLDLSGLDSDTDYNLSVYGYAGFNDYADMAWKIDGGSYSDFYLRLELWQWINLGIVKGGSRIYLKTPGSQSGARDRTIQYLRAAQIVPENFAVFSNLSAGTHYFHLKAIDAAGNYVISHNKIIVAFDGAIIQLNQQANDKVLSNLTNISGSVSDESSIQLFVNGINQLNFTANGTFNKEISLDIGTNLIYATATVDGVTSSSNMMQLIRIAPQAANLSFTLSYSAVGEGLARLAYYDSGNYLFGLASDSQVADTTENPIGVTTNESSSTYIFLARPGADLNIQNRLLERQAFQDKLIPMFGKDLGVGTNAISALIAYNDVVFAGNISFGEGRHALIISNQGTDSDGKNVFVVKAR